jgi:single-stranded-DNA-specific exonuclease
LLPHDPHATERLRAALNVSPALAQLLLNRGVDSADAARTFLHAPLVGLHEPQLLPGVEEAARRVNAAVRAGKRICVYGDYDVDGVTGTTILWRCLQLAGAQADFYVPHRLEEGYGLNADALRTLQRQGVQLLITVDCGIASVAEAKLARELGIELIVTDHHEFQAELPEADVLVHPRLEGSKYPFTGLCGAGVAFKLAWAVAQEFCQARKVSEAFRNFLLESMSLVALATIADVVPLLDENRIFVRHGLKSLKEAPSIGLKALLDSSELTKEKELHADHVGYRLAPRINAVGRLGQARLAVELLACTNEQRAADLARYLATQNEARQKLERRILHEANDLIAAQCDAANDPAFVLASAEWHPGVIGIVAGRLTERYSRPVLMVSLRDPPSQGSGRSIEGLNLKEALTDCAEHLLAYGGHAAAAGFRLDAGQLEPFRRRFLEAVGQRLNGKSRQGTLLLDTEVPLAALTPGLIKGIAALHPHGLGNRSPVFLSTQLQLAGEPKLCGGGDRHLQFRVKQDNGPAVKAIAFDMAERKAELLSAGGQCCLAYTPKRSEYQGMLYTDLHVIDLQAGPLPRLG